MRTKLEVRSCWHNRGYWKNFGSPWICPRSLFSQIFKGRSYVCEYTCQVWSSKLCARSWDNRRYSKHFGSLWIRLRSLFSKIFHELVFRWTLWMYGPNLQSVALAVPEIIATAVLGWVVNPQSWGRGGHRGLWIGPFERALVTSYRPSIVTFP